MTAESHFGHFARVPYFIVWGLVCPMAYHLSAHERSALNAVFEFRNVCRVSFSFLIGQLERARYRNDADSFASLRLSYFDGYANLRFQGVVIIGVSLSKSRLPRASGPVCGGRIIFRSTRLVLRVAVLVWLLL